MTRLKFLRLKAKLTQQYVEQVSGVKRWKIAMAEAGYFKLSDLESKLVAKVLRASPETLHEEV